jgi:hypothetical protein
MAEKKIELTVDQIIDLLLKSRGKAAPEDMFANRYGGDPNEIVSPGREYQGRPANPWMMGADERYFKQSLNPMPEEGTPAYYQSRDNNMLWGPMSEMMNPYSEPQREIPWSINSPGPQGSFRPIFGK